MKVNELIDWLCQQDGDLEVVRYDPDNNQHDHIEPTVDTHVHMTKEYMYDPSLKNSRMVRIVHEKAVVL